MQRLILLALLLLVGCAGTTRRLDNNFASPFPADGQVVITPGYLIEDTDVTLTASVPLLKGKIASYIWDFPSDTVEPAHVITTAGTVTVKAKTAAPDTSQVILSVSTDHFGTSPAYTRQLPVAPAGTTLQPDLPLLVPDRFYKGDVLTVYAYVPLAEGQTAQSYEWDFDPGIEPRHTTTTANSLPLTKVDLPLGTHSLTLTVTTSDFQRIPFELNYTVYSESTH